MFRSNVVPCLNPSNCSNNSCIFGNGKGFLLINLFNSLKSDTNRTVSSFFGIRKDGDCHSERFTFFNTPVLTSQFTSSSNVSNRERGTGNGLNWTGSQFGSFNSMSNSTPFQAPRVPSNREACFFNAFSKTFF